jgi:hypothetical protein
MIPMLKAKAKEPKTHTGVRLDDATLAKVDAYAGRLSEELGTEVTRAMAMRALIVRGLADVEPTAKRSKK